VQKRRHEPEDDQDRSNARDDAMDRSPTPERVKKGPPKKARVIPDGNQRDAKISKENKAPSPDGSDNNDVDVGVLLGMSTVLLKIKRVLILILLASLPPQSLLPLLTSLLRAQPSLKSTIISLIPRPTLETAIEALNISAKKLRDAYPYSNIPPFSQPGPSTTTFGFGSGFGNRSNGGMRESYIISRLRPRINEFVAACMSYLPYFSYIPASASQPSSVSGINSPQSHSAIIQSQQKDASHPSEVFLFLSALTSHVFSQPPLAQSSLGPLLLPRLSEEWKAWVNRVDEVVNRQGGMFGSETVRGWERDLDQFAELKEPEWGNVMREVRNMWVAKVGWLVGRVGHAMEEL
jgi:Cut8, nuclear proteasome tether protein